MKILVIEDDKSTQELLRGLVEKYGSCDVVGDGREAITQFYYGHEIGEPYDVVLLDLMIPILDGHAVFGAIRQYEEEKNLIGNSSTKVIVVTGASDSDNTFEAFSSGCEAFLIKPIDRKKLIEVLDRINK